MKKFQLIFIFIVASIGFQISGYSQGFPSGGGGGESDRIDGKFKFIPLPYIDYNTSIGFSVGAIPMGMFNLSEKDTISPSSIAGLMGMYAENETWFAMGFGMFYINEDRWRIMTAFGTGDIRYQFYLNSPFNKWIPYNTGANFAYISVQRKIFSELYGGLSYMYSDFQTTTEIGGDSVPAQLHGIGIEGSFDKRSNTSYPRSGYFINGNYFTYPSGFNEFSSNQITLDYNHYFSDKRKRDVFAIRATAGIGIGELQFNQQFIVGETDIRGYSAGQFRGNYVLTAQGEYRWNVFKKIGFVGFAGVATVFESINEEDNGRLLPGVGIGFRYTYLKDTHSNIGFDIAKGDGDWGFYFRLSEAF